jgi:hypothetical protein
MRASGRQAYVQPLITPEQPFPDQLTEHDRRNARLAGTHVGCGCVAVMACQPHGAEDGRARHQVQDCTDVAIEVLVVTVNVTVSFMDILL